MGAAQAANWFTVSGAQSALILADHGYHRMHDLGLHGWHLGPIGWLLALAFIVVATVLVIRSLK